MDSQRYLRLVAGLLFLTVCAYCGAALNRLLSPDARQVQACLVSVSRAVQTEGIAIRREELVISDAPSVNAEDGSRLCAGTVLAQNGDASLVVDGSCMYFANADGYEYLGPELLCDLTVSSFCGILRCKPELPRHAAGRLVSGFDWYYAALCPEDTGLQEAQHCRLLFDGFSDPVQATVSSISPAGDGRRVFVFRLLEGDKALLSLRFCSARLILPEESGLRVPVEAIHMDEQGRSFVNISLDGASQRRMVDIIYTDAAGKWCLSALSTRAGFLSEGDSIICG